MRILIWEEMRRKLDSDAAFNVALLRAIDPRLITRRPRDPEKKILMGELGLETNIEAVEDKNASLHRKQKKSSPGKPFEIDLNPECDIDE